MTATLTCAHCGGGLGRGDRFCAQCGAELLACSNCGESLLPQDQSCPECGTPADPVAPPDPLALQPLDSPSPWDDMLERLRRATLGEFELGRELGRGGMAAVFLAHEISLARKVAIKVMSPGLLLDDGMIERFRHEAVTIAHLHHPNIVSVYSVRQAEGLHFFVMQYVQGRSLEQVIERSGPLPVRIVQSILFQVGSALTYAHRCRVIHRDIKPANILIDGDGNAVVTDFGIAKAAQTPSRTLTGALVGTPAYMSPEQCRGSEISGASDQYSLGAVAYEMLTGAPPFGGSTLTVMQAHVEEAPPPIRELAADCPPEVEAAVLRMLAKDPADRWPRIADAMAALGALPLTEDEPMHAELSRLVAVTTLASSTADSTPTSPVPRTGPPVGEPTGTMVSTISILPPPASLEVGDSFVLVATVRGRDGVCLPPNDVIWSCDIPDILRFAGSGGEAVAVGVGTTLLVASCKGVQAILRVEVSPARADEIAIAPLDHGVAVGEEIRLEAVVRDKHGQPIDRLVSWQSEDASVAAVTTEGELVARSPGFTRISAALDNARASLVIPVLPARVAAIHVTERPTIIPAGKSFDVVATPVDRWGSPLPGRRVRWSSSDARVAMPTAEGRVNTIHPGSVVLTASCEGVSESVRVSVAEPAETQPETAAGIAASEEPRRIKLRRSKRYYRERALAAAFGTILIAGTVWFLRRSSPHESAPPAPITLAEGPAEPSGSTESVPGGAEVASVVLTPRTPRRIGPARVVVPVADGQDSAADRPARALSAARDSTVSDSAATADENAAQAATDAAPPAAAVELRVTGARPLIVGETLGLLAELKDGAGVGISGRRVVWSSSNPAVASVDAVTGTIMARSPGTAEITATSDGTTGSTGIQVAPEREPARDRQRIEARVLAGVAQCYSALKSHDVARLTELYRPSTRADRDNLKKLTSILRTREWSAEVGDRKDGLRQIGPETAAMEFSFRLTWKDAFGGRLNSQPIFRTEFARSADRWELSSCRIVGTPDL